MKIVTGITKRDYSCNISQEHQKEVEGHIMHMLKHIRQSYAFTASVYYGEWLRSCQKLDCQDFDVKMEYWRIKFFAIPSNREKFLITCEHSASEEELFFLKAYAEEII